MLVLSLLYEKFGSFVHFIVVFNFLINGFDLCVFRSLTRCMKVGGNVLWVLTLVAFSLTHQELSYIFLWGLSISLSSRELLLEFSTLIQRE